MGASKKEYGAHRRRRRSTGHSFRHGTSTPCAARELAMSAAAPPVKRTCCRRRSRRPYTSTGTGRSRRRVLQHPQYLACVTCRAARQAACHSRHREVVASCLAPPVGPAMGRQGPQPSCRGPPRRCRPPSPSLALHARNTKTGSRSARFGRQSVGSATRSRCRRRSPRQPAADPNDASSPRGPGSKLRPNTSTASPPEPPRMMQERASAHALQQSTLPRPCSLLASGLHTAT